MYWNWCRQTLWVGWKIIRGGNKITGDKITSDTLFYLNVFTVTRSFNKLLRILLAPCFWVSEILCKVPLNPEKAIKCKAGPMLCCYQNRGGWFEQHRRKAQEGQGQLGLKSLDIYSTFVLEVTVKTPCTALSCLLILIQPKELSFFNIIFFPFSKTTSLHFIYLFWLLHVVCGILVPQLGIKLVTPALGVQS